MESTQTEETNETNETNETVRDQTGYIPTEDYEQASAASRNISE